MVFDPKRIPDGGSLEGHLDIDALAVVLLRILEMGFTGRITTEEPAGPNHLFFQDGHVLGVHLSTPLWPLGQLFLELRLIDGETFVKAQHVISDSGRLPGRVFRELAGLSDSVVDGVLQLQTRRRTAHFCQSRGKRFTLVRGAAALAGAIAAPMSGYAAVLTALREQGSAAERAQWLSDHARDRVRMLPQPGDTVGLPVTLAALGLGAAEQAVLELLGRGPARLVDVQAATALPPSALALLVQFAELLGRLERTPPADVPRTKSVDAIAPERAGHVPAPVSAGQVPRATPPSDPGRVAQAAPPASVFAGPSDVTDPRMVGVDIDFGFAEPTAVVATSAPAPVEVTPMQGLDPKQKGRRTAPPPSLGSGTFVSETRKEKTMVGPLPTILIDDDPQKR